MDELRAGMDILAEPAQEEIIRNFATVGEVYEDGISLIFDWGDGAVRKALPVQHVRHLRRRGPGADPA